MIRLPTAPKRARQVLTLGAVLPLALACSSGQSTLPQSEGAPRIIEHPAADERERSANHISLVEDLALTDDLRRPFHTPDAIAVDLKGGIYVGDSAESVIHAFDASGAYRTTIGRPGPGPGEIEFLRGLTVVGDNLVAITAQYQMTTWGLDGEFREIVTGPLDVRGLPVDVRASDEASIVMVTGDSSRWERYFFVYKVSLAGEVRARYGDVVAVSTGLGMPPLRNRINPLWAVSPTGAAVYTAVPDAYEVTAYGRDGAPSWVMTAEYAAPKVDDAVISRALDAARRVTPSASRGDYQWPERFKPLRHLSVDGHGHLFVYLFTEDAAYADGERIPGSRWMVDVYSPEGERLFVGTIDGPFWVAAQGDYVYCIEEDRETAEYAVTRRLIVEPF